MIQKIYFGADPEPYLFEPEYTEDGSYLAGDYFQALRNIITPAAPMVRQQSSLIITPEWEFIFERDANGLIRFNDLC